MVVRVFLVLSSAICLVYGHGKVMNPPARNVLWRFGFASPVNYDDNEVWCGGFGVQYGKNEGKCGVCGDDYSLESPRPHEAGGKFGKGIIGRTYVMGQKIDIEIDLSANHYGHFELKLCPVNNVKEIVTQECLDKYPLYLADNPTSYKFVIPEATKKKDYLTYQVLLPRGVSCKQCVMQWTYHTGNTWGDCQNGTEAVGCGDQETFRNCADVKIVTNTAGYPPNAINSPAIIYIKDQDSSERKRPLVVRSEVCIPTEKYEDNPDLYKWCQQNCLKYPPACNKEMCRCRKECWATGKYEGKVDVDAWCHKKCMSYSSECPKEKCKCTFEQ